ncbi:MAG: phosphatidate cytidylyltransferase [Methylacidiphilales bacterium]|nr:phosphatidate cytidylyltransferase [Candidatus Methylacidiphilales bacterium]MDW8349178.1 CDP-archaeol synthase [Verrucomicrobiae bacterium]
MVNTNFWWRFGTSLALWAVVFGLIFSGWNFGSWVVLTLFGLAAQWEFYRAQEEKHLRVYKHNGIFCGLLLFLGVGYFLVLRPEQAGNFGLFQELTFVVLIISVLIRLVLVPEPNSTPILTVALTVFGFFYVSYLFSFAALLSYSIHAEVEGRFLLLYLLIVTKFTDMGAYLTGMLIGRHKMIPHISPKKTWEGFVGGLVFAITVSVALAYLFPNGLKLFHSYHAYALGLLLALASVVGDLAESVVKRDAHIKDSGKSIPGIGGALDLIDSLLFTAPVLYFYLKFILLPP